MRTFLSAVLAFVVLSLSSAWAQAPSAEADAERRAAMARLSFLVGTYEGEGWMFTPDGVRRTFTHVERAEMRAGGLVLTVEGAARSESDPPDAPGFRAFGVIAWNDSEDRYEMQTYAYGRPYAVTGALAADNAFVWGFSPNEAVDIRYTITAPDPQTWSEIGEISMDDGATWRQFFAMRLTRIAEE